MKILQCHNYYQQPGGEDRVLAEEKALLEDYGHTVEQYVLHNDDVARYTRLQLLGKTVWSREARHDIRERVLTFKPDVVHVHNTLPLMSPSIYSAARSAGAAVVQTLHNYRLVCPGAYCQLDGTPCEKCVHKTFKWPAVRHACYRENRAATASIAGMLAAHHLLGTFRKHIDLMVTCSRFARDKFVAAGFDPDHIVCKPNFLREDLGVGHGDGKFAMFLGRLSPEKGIGTLIEAWDRDDLDLPLHVAGGGPMADAVRDLARRRRNVKYLGHCPREMVEAELRAAALLVFPSQTYEGMPMTLLEAMQAGTPIVGSDRGAIPELVMAGKTGRVFPPGDADALRDAVKDMMGNPPALRSLRGSVRHTYEIQFSAEPAYRSLIDTYRRAITRRHDAAAASSVLADFETASLSDDAVLEENVR